MNPKLPPRPAPIGIVPPQLLGLLGVLLLPMANPPAAQEEPAPAQEQKTAKPPPKFPPPATDREARNLRREFRMALRRGRRKPEKRLQAVEALLARSHEDFVKPLLKLAFKDQDPRVRYAALEALGRLDYPESRKALLGILGGKEFRERHRMLLGALAGLERMGYRAAYFPHLKALFEQGLEKKDRVEVQRKILHLFWVARDSQAFPFQLSHLDPPAPENVDDPSNPPASYWKMRWEIWSEWKQEVRRALFSLTHQKYYDAASYRKWAETEEGRKRLVETDRRRQEARERKAREEAERKQDRRR